MAETKAQLPQDDYQAQDDVRTLTRAHEIRNNPKRHKAAKAHAKKQLAALQAVGGMQPMGQNTEGNGGPAGGGNPY